MNSRYVTQSAFLFALRINLAVRHAKAWPTAATPRRTVVNRRIVAFAFPRASEEGDGNNSTADADDYVARYGYDLASNRTSVAKDSGNYDNSAFTADTTTIYTYDANDRLLSVEQSGANTQYTQYIYNGTQQTSETVWTDNTKTTKVSQTTYEYNAEGRMSKTEIDSNGDGTIDTTIQYTYSDDGLRVTTTKTINGSAPQVTQYLFDADNPTGQAQTLEERVNGSLSKTFIIGQNVIAVGSAVQTNNLLAFLYDLHGSTRALVDTNGQIYNDTGTNGKGIQAFTYDAYGNMIATGFGAATQSDALTNLLYSGQFTNAATGLQYLRSRYYDPNTARFTRMDTYAGNVNDPLSLNKYAYANGNPVMMSDPSGRFSLIGSLGTISIISTLGGTVSGTVSAFTGGSFILGFAKGFLATGVSTVLLLLTPLKNIYIDNTIGNTVANLIVGYFDGELKADPKLVAEEIVAGVVVSLTGTAIFNQVLPEFSTNLEDIAIVIEQRFPAGSLGTLTAELGPAVVRSSLISEMAVLPTQLVITAHKMVKWLKQQSQETQQRINQEIKNAGG